MKGQTIADIPLIGVMATTVIVVFGILPPAIIKTTLDRELSLTYDYEKTQYLLLSLLSSTDGTGKPISQVIAENENNVKNLEFLKTQLSGIAKCYSLKIGSPDSFTTLVEEGSCEKSYVFTTSIALPYNPDAASQIKLVRIELG